MLQPNAGRNWDLGLSAPQLRPRPDAPFFHNPLDLPKVSAYRFMLGIGFNRCHAVFKHRMVFTSLDAGRFPSAVHPACAAAIGCWVQTLGLRMLCLGSAALEFVW